MNNKGQVGAALTMDTEAQQGLFRLRQTVRQGLETIGDREKILASLCAMTEALLPDALAVIMLRDAERNCLKLWIAPSASGPAKERLDGFVCNLKGGPCGRACSENTSVFVADLSAEQGCESLLAIFRQLGIRACWSSPFGDREDHVAGTFSLFFPVAREPAVFHREIMETAAALVSFCLQGARQQALIGQSEDQLKLANVAMENATECFFIFYDRYIVSDVNPAVFAIFGYRREEIIGRDIRFLLSSRNSKNLLQELRSFRANRCRWQGEIWAKHANGSRVQLWVSLSVVSQGEEDYCLAACTDLTCLKISQQQLARLAHYDQLTGLSNRRRLCDRVEHAIDLGRRGKARLALLLLDVDRFKNLNDTFGRRMGDEVLVLLAKRLQEVLREQDTLARLSGDEFVALLENAGSEGSIYRVAEKLLRALKTPISLHGEDFLLNGSIGIAIYPKDGGGAEELLTHADTAMHTAKCAGGGSISFYEAALTERMVKAFSIESDLRKALERDEFALCFQPKVYAATGEITGVEALIRWQHPDKGLISPMDFIPIAEETGLIVPIGEWVLNKVIELQQSWRAEQRHCWRISVNISGRQLNSRDIDRLIVSLTRSGVATELLELELTETFLMSDPELSALQLAKLSATGVSLAIDDFGMGYSSLGYLKRFDVDSLKIDRLLIRDLETDPDDLAIVGAVIALAHSLNMQVVAEGVETERQVELLTQAGCDELQGFYFYRPMPLTELENVFQ